MPANNPNDESRLYRYLIHTSAYTRFGVQLRMVARHGFDPQFVGKIIYLFLNSALTAPLRIVERTVYSDRIREHNITRAPIFILGHWRSGTTLLHSLLAQDPRFGYVSLYQTVAPDLVFTGRGTIKPLVTNLAPKRRPADNLLLPVDGPQEDEVGLSGLSVHSLYHFLQYPRKLPYFFDRYGTLEKITPDAYAEMKEKYEYIVKTASYLHDGKPVVLKNPANTGRVPMLLELYPDARFIHIHRNPYEVFYSALRFFQSSFRMGAVQNIDDETLRENFLYVYEKMMKKLDADLPSIPTGNLVELPYEMLLEDPLRELEAIYDRLDLGSFDDVRPHIEAEIAQRSGHKPKAYQYDDAEMIARINERWAFAFERWGYDMIQP